MSEAPDSEEVERVHGTVIGRDEDYVDAWSSRFSIGFTDDRMFFVDFRKPDLRGFSDDEGNIEMRGNLISVASVHLPPKAAKELSDILSEHVDQYEEQFGEIETNIREEASEE